MNVISLDPPPAFDDPTTQPVTDLDQPGRSGLALPSLPEPASVDLELRVRRPAPYVAEVRKLDLSADGSTLLALSRVNHQPTISVFPTSGGFGPSKPTAWQYSAYDGVVSPDGKVVVVLRTEQALAKRNSGSSSNSVDGAGECIVPSVMACHPVWQGARKPLFEPAGARNSPLAFSRDGLLFAAGMERDRVAIFSLGTAKGRCCTVLNHTDDILLAAFSPDARRLVTASRDSTLRVSCCSTGVSLGKLEIQTHQAPRLLRISPDGQLIVSVWGQQYVHLWRPETGDLAWYNLNVTRRTMEGWPIAISPDCRYLACRIEDGLDITDVQTGTVVGLMSHMGSPITAACFSLGGELLYVGKLNGVIEEWQLSCSES